MSEVMETDSSFDSCNRLCNGEVAVDGGYGIDLPVRCEKHTLAHDGSSAQLQKLLPETGRDRDQGRLCRLPHHQADNAIGEVDVGPCQSPQVFPTQPGVN